MATPTISGFDAVSYIRDRYDELPLLRKGARGWHVKLLRRAMAQLGFAPAAWWTAPDVSDEFDEELRRLVIQLQQVNRLEVDGVVGKQSWGFLSRGGRNLVEYSLAVARNFALTPPARIVGIAEALAALDIREGDVNNTGPEVEQILRFAGGKPTWAYCVAFADFCTALGYRSLGQEPPFRAGLSSSMLRNKALQLGRLVEEVSFVKPGYLGIVRGGPTGWRHVFVVRSIRKINSKGLHRIFTAEGNTNAGGSSEGDGIYLYQRQQVSGVARPQYVFVRTY